MTADVTRLMTMSIADLLDDWFESPQIKGAMAVNGVIGTWAGPYEPGTAYVMAHHSIGDVGDGQLGSWGYPEGGMGAVSAAIAPSARELRRRDPHQRKGFAAADRAAGRFEGAVLEIGDEITAPLVVTTLHPKIAFLDQVPRNELPDDFVADIEHWKTRSGVVKINLALAELPNFTAESELRAWPSITPARSRWRRRWSTSSRRSRTRARASPRRCRSATASSRPAWTGR